MSIYYDFQTGSSFNTKAELNAFIKNGRPVQKPTEKEPEKVKEEVKIENDPVEKIQETDIQVEDEPAEDEPAEDEFVSERQTFKETYASMTREEKSQQLLDWGVDKRRFNRKDDEAFEEFFWEMFESL